MPWSGAHGFPVAPSPTVVALNMNVYKLKQRVIILIIAFKTLSSLTGLTISCLDFTINIGIGSTHHAQVLNWMTVQVIVAMPSNVFSIHCEQKAFRIFVRS